MFEIHTKKNCEMFRISIFRTVHRKYNTVKNAISVYKGSRPTDRDGSDPSFQSIASKYQHDPERSRLRMQRREANLKAMEEYNVLTRRGDDVGASLISAGSTGTSPAINNNSFRYMRRQPTIIEYPTDELKNNRKKSIEKGGSDNPSFEIEANDYLDFAESGGFSIDGPGKKMTLNKPLEVIIIDLTFK